MENMLGILGGMGPMASRCFYDLLIRKTRAEKDQDHLNFMLLNHASMPDRTSAILANDTQELERLLLEDCRILENAGCKAICVTCNTSHYILHKIERDLKVPLISLVREACSAASKSYPGKKVAVLATDGAIQTELYQNELKANGVIPYTPSTPVQKAVMKLIYDCVKAGKKADKETVSLIEKELKKENCAAAILACTELPILKEEGFFTEPEYLDPMEIMAEKALTFMGKPLVK